jgi:cytochrome c oxidase subunit 2
MEPAAYQAWLSGTTVGTSLAARGEQLFNDLACNSCHRSSDSDRGPSLVSKFGTSQALADGSTVTVNETYVRESILTPQVKITRGFQPSMPTFQGLISEENVMALVEYLKTLKAPVGSVSAAPQENK